MASRKIPGPDTDRRSRREAWGVFSFAYLFFARAKKSRSRAAGVRKPLRLPVQHCRKKRNHAHRKSNADITKFSTSTSNEALTTARVVATEVPSIVGSAW